ncbi:MAG: Mur ligase family protein [Pseudomonadota bacterium]
MAKPINPYLKPSPKDRQGPTNEELERSAHLARERSKAVFIGITGSSAKSSTTALLDHILSGQRRVDLQLKLNSMRKTLDMLSKLPDDAELVVAELGVSSEDPFRTAAQAFQPNTAVVTMIAMEHLEKFDSEQEIAAEKAELLSALRPGGVAILNADDPFVMGMARVTNERIVTFGRSENATYRVSDVQANYPNRLSLTITHAGKPLALRTRFVGEHHWLATTAAVSTALEHGVPGEVIAKRVASFEPLSDRFGAIETANGPNFIVDTAKTYPHSLKISFDAIAKASVSRKRIVMGPLSETDDDSPIYREVYRSAIEAADQVIFVGKHFQLSDASQEDVDAGRFFLFETAKQVEDFIRETAMPGELILVKGSFSLHLERIGMSWREKVRCWHPECGVRIGCMDCGRYGFSFEWHQGYKHIGKVRRLLNKLNLHRG